MPSARGALAGCTTETGLLLTLKIPMLVAVAAVGPTYTVMLLMATSVVKK